MARYIDADKIHEFVDTKVAEGKDGWAKGVPYEWAYALTVIDMQPTADVAPMSEVEYLKAHLEMWCNKHKKAREEIEQLEAKLAQYQLDLHYSVSREDDAYNRGYEKATTDGAKEIFDELEFLSIDGKIAINSVYYAELKKKYTENC